MPESENRLNDLGKKAAALITAMKGAPSPSTATDTTAPAGSTGESGRYVPVRKSPKGTVLEHQTKDSVTLSFKAAIRFWWMLPYALLVVTVLGSLPLGLFIGTFLNPFELWQAQAWQTFFNISLFFTPVLLLAATIISLRLTQPWVRLVANREHIQVGSLVFQRKLYAGMRLGYEIKTTNGILKNDFHDLSIGLQGIRLSYGLWGEDLPYLVNGYHANEIVLWLNMKISETAAPVQAPLSTSGDRQQTFE